MRGCEGESDERGSVVDVVVTVCKRGSERVSVSEGAEKTTPQTAGGRAKGRIRRGYVRARMSVSVRKSV